MADSSLRNRFLNFELSTGGPCRPSNEINYICIPTAEGVKKSIVSALETLPLSRGQSFLVQFWAAIEIGRTYVLTTTCQPFGFCGFNQELESYRIACLDHKLYVHPEKRVAFGLPGRAFLNLIPEQTQNVHDYPEDQRPPCRDDIFSKIWGAFAVPVIEANKCIGVLEFITDPSQESYHNDIGVVHFALKHAGLQYSTQIHHPGVVTASPITRKSIRRTYSFTKTKYSSLVPYFGLSSVEAAKRLEIRQSTFRNVRSRVGIPEWPWLPSYKAAEAFSAVETESNPTAAGTTFEPTTSEDVMPNRDMEIDENSRIQTGACFPETQSNGIIAYDTFREFGIPDFSYTQNGASFPDVQINQIAYDDQNNIEPWTDFEPYLAHFIRDYSDKREDEGNIDDHNQEMSISSSLLDFESYNYILPCYD